MAIRKETIGLMFDGIKSIGMNFKNAKICELGNQHTKDDPKFKTGKDYFSSLGAEHVSMDLNGEDGSIVVDLSNPITKWNGYFDMVTNYGTTEHINNQHVVFGNIHNLVRKGGVMIHALPLYDYWSHHGFYNYNINFFDELSKSNDYKVILNEPIPKKDLFNGKRLYYLGVICIKEADNIFVCKNDFDKIKGIISNN